MNEQLNPNGACTIDAVSKQQGGFGWRWRAGGREETSSRLFPYFYECLDDARKNGFRIEVHEVVDHLVKRCVAMRSDPQGCSPQPSKDPRDAGDSQ